MKKFNVKGFEKTWVIAKKFGPTQCNKRFRGYFNEKSDFLSLENIIVKSHARLLGNSFL